MITQFHQWQEVIMLAYQSSMGGDVLSWHDGGRPAKRQFFLHKHGLSKKYFTLKNAWITTNLVCDKTAWKAQQTQIVQKMTISNIKFQNVQKNSTKKRRIAPVLTFTTKQRKILQRFYTR